MSSIILSANTDWYLYNFRLSLARAASDQGFDVHLVSPDGAYAESLRASGFDWRPIGLSRRGLNPYLDLRTFLRYLTIYRELKPDLVHHFTIKPVIYGSLAARAGGIPAVVNSITGLGYLFVNPSRVARLLQFVVFPLFRLALGYRRSLTIFQNERDATSFAQWKLVRSDRSLVIPSSGVDIEKFRPSPEPEGEPVVLLPARMLWDKGVGELVEAARLLRQRGTRARFVLVGDADPGNPATIEISQLRKWQDEGIVEWWGFQDDMPQAFARSQVVVLPSYGEGISKSLIEAAAAGRPIVASDVPGCRDVVEEGVNGILVPPRDPQSLATAIERLLGAPALRAQMGEAGRAIAVRRFNDRLINDRTLMAYERLLAPRGVPAVA